MRLINPVTAYIALGANLGDRERNIRQAIEKLRETDGITNVAVSNLLENPAEGMADNAPPFLNGAAKLETTIAAHALLHRLLEIEHEMGRQRRQRWEPRLIDLDLLLYGDQILASKELVVPHPLMHDRRFVLEPLAQIAPNVVHPTLQLTMQSLLENLKTAPK